MQWCLQSRNSCNQTPSYTELQKLYQLLQKDHEQIGKEFQHQQQVNEETAHDLKERERDADELVNLVHMKCDIMKTLEKRLALVKR